MDLWIHIPCVVSVTVFVGVPTVAVVLAVAEIPDVVKNIFYTRLKEFAESLINSTQTHQKGTSLNTIYIHSADAEYKIKLRLFH
jgi:hypothetical protein